MKAVYTILSSILITATLWAQSPQKMSYQALVRDGSNNLVKNSPVGIRVSLLQGSATGTEIYKEIFNPNPQTNSNGLLTVEIGGGVALTGIFSNIDWANGPYFIKVETDPTGGTSYTISGTSQLLSVPYAFYAKTSGAVAETDPVFAASPAFGITGTNINNWNTAYSWGNHASAGYLTTESDPQVGSNTLNYLSKWDGTALVTSSVFDNGSIGIGTNAPGQKLDVSGGSIRTTGQFITTQAAGTSPFAVTSTTAVTNLNCDLLDGSHAASFALSSHNHDHNTLTNLQLAGSSVTYGHISSIGQTIDGSKTFAATVNSPSFNATTATGTKPISVASSTLCDNLNADMVDGKHQDFHTEWLSIVSGTTTTYHTFYNSTLETVGTYGRIQLKCTNGNQVDYIAYLNGARSTGTLANAGIKIWDLVSGDDLKIILTPAFNDFNTGIIEIHDMNGQYMSGMVWDTYSDD